MDAIIVGGGAERGLGAAVAQRLAREGHRVLVAGRTKEKRDAFAEACWPSHLQHRSAWTPELDLRPYKEPS